jgi:hypothetical protein
LDSTRLKDVILEYQLMHAAHGEVYLIPHYVIKVVSDMRQVGGFRQVLWFPPPIKLTTTL